MVYFRKLPALLAVLQPSDNKSISLLAIIHFAPFEIASGISFTELTLIPNSIPLLSHIDLVISNNSKILSCLTWPGIWLKIKRPDHINCSFEDENGEINNVTMMGLECRIFQHEMDHMEGTNFTNRVSKLKMDRAKKRAAKMKKKSMVSMT